MRSIVDARLQWLLAAAVVIIYILINTLTLKDGHDWGGDFAQYIIHARNVVEGKAYTEGIYFRADPAFLSRNGMVIYPPGFPLILAPALAVFGLNWALLKALGVLFWLLTAGALFLMWRRSQGTQTALLASTVLLFAPRFFVLKQSVLSDIPFAFFCALTVLLYAQFQDAGEGRAGLAALAYVAPAAAALLIRPAGVALFAALGAHLFFVKGKWRAGAVALGGFLCASAVNAIFGVSASYGAHAVSGLGRIAERGIDVLNHQMQMLGALFVGVPQSLDLISTALGYALLGAFAWHVWRRRCVDFAATFVLMYMAMLVLWGHEQGIRFILPVAGFYLCYAVELVRDLFKAGWVAQALLAGVLVLSGIYIALRFDFNVNHIGAGQTQELRRWVEESVGPSEHYAFRKPRPLALLTGRTGWIFRPNLDLQRQLRWLQRHDIRYLILGADEEQDGIKRRVRRTRAYPESYENEQFTVFDISAAGRRPDSP